MDPINELYFQFQKIPSSLRKLLKREVARELERAFRRGFQQGFLTGSKSSAIAGVERTPTEDEVCRWRFRCGKFEKNYDKAVSPPGHRRLQMTSVRRMEIEASELMRIFDHEKE